MSKGVESHRNESRRSDETIPIEIDVWNEAIEILQGVREDALMERGMRGALIAAQTVVLIAVMRDVRDGKLPVSRVRGILRELRAAIPIQETEAINNIGGYVGSGGASSEE